MQKEYYVGDHVVTPPSHGFFCGKSRRERAVLSGGLWL